MQLFWRLVAHFLANHPRAVDWLIQRAQRTPYTHIASADGKEVYMGRYWLFNPYGRDADNNPTPARWPWLPSVRIHHIRRADQDRDLHDHPWNARTIVLRGWYEEERPTLACSAEDLVEYCTEFTLHSREQRATLLRQAGYTGRLLFGQYHRISRVSPGGVWTLFITGRHRGEWGFQVKGRKVPWRVYLGLDKGDAA